MRTFSLIILAAVIYSCAGIKVRRACDVKNQDKGIFYSLPENVITTEIVLEEKKIFKGPYAEYAKDLLSIENVPLKNSTEYIVKQILIGSYSIPDPEHYYFAYPACREILSKVSTDDQLILCGYNVNCPEKKDFPLLSYLKGSNIPVVPFPDACNDGTVKEVSDTTYKTIQTDSTFVRVPVLKKNLEAKTIADKAEDAANHLMRVRKRMFKFVSGAYKIVPAEGTVEPITEELKREENEYLSLFTGREFVNRFAVKLSFVPEKDTTIVLAWFSEKYGLSSVQKQGFVPITAEVQTLDHLDTLKKYSVFPGKKTRNGLVYRIPCRTRISLKVNNAIIAQRDILVSQMGVLKVMPSALLRKTKNGVILNPASED